MHRHNAGCFVHTFPLFRSVRWYACHARLCHLFSMHLYTLVYMSMHESCLLVCCPYFNTMKLWISNPNLHLSLANTTFCFLSCLFAFLPIHLLSCFFDCHFYHAYLLYAIFICSLQKGRICNYVDMSQAAMFNGFRGLAFSIWLCTL